ncbi:MAG: ferredoxin [Candidatus Omnitrophota bacterium]
MKAIVDPDICIGCTICTQVCPEVYKMAGEKVIVYLDSIPEQLESSVQDAANQCPVSAINIEK